MTDFHDSYGTPQATSRSSYVLDLIDSFKRTAEMQILLAQRLIEQADCAPLDLGEALEDIANRYMDVSDEIARQRRAELAKRNG